MRGRHAVFPTSFALLAAIVLAVFSLPEVRAQSAPRELPARSIPVPDTVSPQMRKIIAAPINPNWKVFPKSAEEWRAQINAAAAIDVQALPAMREYLHALSNRARSTV